MPILESIKAAEEKAEQLRSEATKAVEALLEQTRKTNEEKARQLLEKANEQVRKIDADTSVKIAQKEKEINLAYEKKDQEALQQAQSRTDQAIGFILKKVFEI